MTKPQRKVPAAESAEDETSGAGAPETEDEAAPGARGRPDPAAEAGESEGDCEPAAGAAAIRPAAGADETSPDAGAAPRLDRLGGRLRARAGETAERRPVDFTVRDDDEDDAAFGPKLAAWLEAYRARQAANAETETPPRKVHMLAPAPAGQAGGEVAAGAPADANRREAGPPPLPHAAFAGEARPAWAGRARLAFEDMIAADGCSPPPEWVAARQDPAPPRHPGSRWLMVAALGCLMAGTATVAFVAAARNAGVDPTLATMLAAFGGPSVSARDDEGAAAVPEEPPAPARPRVEIVDTRVVPATLETRPVVEASVKAEPPPPRRSVLLLPTGPRPAEDGARDHPQLAPVNRPPRRSAAVEAAIEAASRPAEAAAKPAREPIDEAARPVPVPAEIRVASLNPVLGFIGPPSGESEKGREDGAPSLDLVNRRAHALLRTGDVMSARLLYEMAARSGDAEAALGAGLTYDPMQFEHLGVRGIEPDAGLAIAWYRKALGNGEKAAIDEIERLEAWLRR